MESLNENHDAQTISCFTFYFIILLLNGVLSRSELKQNQKKTIDLVFIWVLGKWPSK